MSIGKCLFCEKTLDNPCSLSQARNCANRPELPPRESLSYRAGVTAGLAEARRRVRAKLKKVHEILMEQKPGSAKAKRLAYIEDGLEIALSSLEAE